VIASWYVASSSPFLVADSLEYNRDIRPILAEHCFSCHGFDKAARAADLRLDNQESSSRILESGSVAIQPAQPERSELIRRINSTDEDLRMPPAHSGKRLSEDQKQKLRSWIADGAKYDDHWAFIVPQRPIFEKSDNAENIVDSRNAIDRLVLERLSESGLAPSSRAEPATLIRRVSLDLTGIPPTLDEVDYFLTAHRKDRWIAWVELVERLLTSPCYGERWGKWWLDQARYADSNGYSVDAPRPIWPYRDWVIDALNQDMPFDRFTVEQLAGDLLPDATQSQRIATGFHRNTPINQEGGIDAEQFRIDNVIDRVSTTGTVWLGLTIGCAQCHDHKFDPIEQQEFYRLFAFFNNQDEPELTLQTTDATKAAKTLVLKERLDRRKTHLLVQGDFTRPAQEVECGTPAVLHAFESSTVAPTRLDLANWIMSHRNPLTARVIANRVWQQYFGRGIVETENDFGIQGSSPTHPKLLDWLAVELVESGWSLKHLHRKIVLSETYQQSSFERPDLQEADRGNYFLARQLRLRLDGEIVRDIGLVASGLVTGRIGGPSVFPPIPEGVMERAQVKREWKASVGTDRFRRGIYTFMYRSNPTPSLNVFDAPDGTSACTRRMRSNTPLQALTLLNDSSFVEMAQALASIIQSEGIEVAFRRCTGRNPREDEQRILAELAPDSAARVLLNLDETVTRE